MQVRATSQCHYQFDKLVSQRSVSVIYQLPSLLINDSLWNIREVVYQSEKALEVGID